MPTLAQLRSEPWWDREIVTTELDWLGDELCRRTGRPRVAFGSKGNTAHLKGAHRSQEWILNSRYCTSRTSTVQSGLTATQARHIAGADFTPGDWGTQANRALMVQQTTRLRNAMVRDQLAGVTQVIGTLNGRTVVGTRADGSTFSSDDSHLDHWHLTLDRRRLTDRALMERILAVALGEDNDMDFRDGKDGEALIYRIAALIDGSTAVGGGPTRGEPVVPNVKLAALAARVEAIAAADAGRDAVVRGLVEQLADVIRAGGGSVDTTAILAGVDARLEAARADVRDAVADLGEGGAAQVRGPQA